MKLLFTLIAVISMFYANQIKAQTLVFSEDFETSTAPDSVSHYGSGIYGKSSVLHSNGAFSDSLNTLNVNDTVRSTTSAFSTIGYSAVYLYFDHICKTEFFDDAYIEVSTNGTTWNRLTGVHYLGSGNFAVSGNKFTASSYISDWKAGYSYIPTNSWWKTEMFDISAFAANSASVQVRFVLRDGGVTFNGPDDYAWFIDDIKVKASVHELLPPVISWANPILPDTSTSSTQYPVYATIIDGSGIDTALLIYHSNGGVADTIGMTMIATDTFKAYIPFQGFGRTVTYFIRANDNSGAQNSAVSSSKYVYAKYSTLFTYEFTGNNLSDGYHGPIYRNSASSTFDYSRYAYLITQSEMVAKGILPGYIKEIAWYKTSGIGTVGGANFDIYAKNTAKTGYVTGYVTVPWDTAITGCSKVFSSTTYMLPAAEGWVNFNLNPFYYNGGALEIVTDYDVSGFTGQPGGPINWRFSDQFTTGRTLGSSSSSPTSILAAFIYGGAYRTDIRLKLEMPYSLQNDAGIAEISSPTNGISANIPFYLTVKLKNYGVDTLDIVTVKWSVDGVQNGVALLSSSLLQNQVSTVINLDTITLPAGVHRIKVWTESPNSLVDQNIANDTAYFSTMACSGPLAGTYQVGQGGNFASFGDAVIALHQCGVSGPVVFDVSAGTYYEHIKIGSIVGASAVNTITFKSANGDSSSVLLKFSNAGNQNNYLVKLEGTKYLTFSALSFNNQSNSYAKTLVLSQNCSNLKISNCRLIGATTNIMDENQSIIFADSASVDSAIIIKNNYFTDGYQGIYLRGTSISNLARNILIESNVFENQAVLALNLKYLNAPAILSNDIFTNKLSISSQGVSFTHLKNKWRFEGNKVDLITGNRAVAIWNCNSSNGSEAQFFNNMISAGGSVLNYLIDFENGSGVKFYNNSFHKFANTTGSVFYINTFPSSATTDSLYFKNNIFANSTSTGYIINLEYSIGTRKLVFNNNDYFTGSTTFSKNGSAVAPDFIAWKTSINQEVNGLNANPAFVSNNNLHITNFYLKGMGASLPEVSVDFDGNPRNTANPTIGAHELIDLTYDIQLVDVTAPVSGCALTNSELVTVVLRNNGLNAINQPFTLSYKKLNSSQVITETINQNIAVGDTFTHNFTNTVDLSMGSWNDDSTFVIKVWASFANDQFNFNDTIYQDAISGYKPPVPTASTFSTNYGTPVVINVTSSYTVNWFEDTTSSTVISVGNFYLTPALFDTTTFYAASKWSGVLGCYSDRIPVRVNITNYPARDAGVSSILSPLGQNSSNDTLQLKVRVKNYGLNNLTSVKIAYSIDGVLKDSVSWVGNIARDSMVEVLVDDFKLSPGQHVLKTWTYKPNGLSDQFMANDTMSTTILSCMSGVYTLGPVGSSLNPDYNSFSAAFNALSSGGVCGNVTFMVENGQYNENIVVNGIPNTGPNARVLFKSISGDSSLVKIYKTFSGSETALLKLNGVNYLGFQEIGFKTISATSYGRVIELANSNNNSWENCLIEGNVLNSSSNVHAAVYWNTGFNNYNVFNNNKVTGGSSGFYLYGPTTGTHSKANFLTNNNISGYYFAGILSSYEDSMVITGNEVRNPVSGSSTVYGIYLYKSDFAGLIARNTVDISSGIAGSGIYVSSCAATPYERLMIVNNMVVAGAATGTAYGLNCTTVSNINIFFNSFNVVGASTLSRGIYFNASNNVDFRNNIAMSNMGFAVYFNGVNVITTMDYNSYRTSGAAFAYFNNANILSFSAYKSSTGFDSHSIYGLAPFTSNSDLHLNSQALSAKAQFIATVIDDIDGDTRSAYPTIGADEIPLAAIDMAVVQVIVPAQALSEHDTISPKIVIRNMGTSNQFNFQVSYSVNGGSPFSLIYTDTLSLFESDTITMNYFISPAGNYNLCGKVQLANDLSVINNEVCLQLSANPFNDLDINRISGLEKGCNLSFDTVKLVVSNLGSSSLTGNITAHYKVNSSPAVTQVFNKTIGSFDSTTLVFSALVDLSAVLNDTVFDIVAWVDFAGDNVSSNDSSSITIVSKVSPAQPVANPVTVAYGTGATITATSAAGTTINWYETEYSQNILTTGSNYSIPVVYSSDTIWVESKSNPNDDSTNIGIGTILNTPTGWPSPFGGYEWSNKEQYLILASELSDMEGGNIIEKLVFFVSNANSCPGLNDYVIKMRMTNANSITGWVPGPFTTVFNTTSYFPTAGENRFEFQNPFVWDGVSNLVVEVCFSNVSWVNNGNASVYSSVTPFNSVARYGGSYAGVCTAPGSYSILATRPNMKFIFQEEGCPSPRLAVPVNVTGVQPTDLGVEEIISPVSSPNLTNAETVKVKIMNFGSAQQFNFPVSFVVDTLQFTDIVVDTIQSGDSLIYTFSNFADLGLDGKMYSIKAFTGASGDITAFNDTSMKTVVNQLSPYCASGSGSGVYTDISFVEIGSWSNYSTPTGNTYSDFTATVARPNLAIGNPYPLTLTSSHTPGSTTSSQTYVKVWVDLNKDNQLSDANELIYGNYTSPNNTVTGQFNIPLGSSPGYTLMRVVLMYLGGPTSTQPCGYYQYGETEDYIINILPQQSCDAGVMEISQPSTMNIAGAQQPVWVKIKNFGTDTIQANNLTLNYIYAGGLPQTVLYPQSLEPQGVDSVQLPNLTVQLGDNNLVATVTLACDSFALNNSLTKVIFGNSVQALPFNDDFEGVNTWHSTDYDVWQIGAPQGTNIVSAPSGSKVWMTELDEDYLTSALSYLHTPAFDFSMLSASDTVILSFDNALYTEFASDYARVEFTKDGGSTWATLGYVGDNLATNWYNHASNGIHFWTGNHGWENATMKLDPSVFNQANPVTFRFMFRSDGANSYDGWAIDNFKLDIQPIDFDAAIVEVINPVDSIFGGQSDTVKLVVRNNGLAPISSLSVGYEINGQVFSETHNLPTPLNFTGLDTLIFTSPFTAPLSSFNLKAWVSLTNDTRHFNDTLLKSVGVGLNLIDVGITTIDLSDTIFIYNYQGVPMANKAKVMVKNFGATPVSQIPISMWTHGNFNGTAVINANLNTGDSILYIFPDTIAGILGTHNVCLKTQLAGDVDTTNDLICKYISCLMNGIEGVDNSTPHVGQLVPNPNHGMAILPFNLQSPGEVFVTVYDIVGNQVWKKSLQGVMGENLMEIDSRNFNQGLYMVRFQAQNFECTRRMVITR